MRFFVVLFTSLLPLAALAAQGVSQNSLLDRRFSRHGKARHRASHRKQSHHRHHKHPHHQKKPTKPAAVTLSRTSPKTTSKTPAASSPSASAVSPPLTASPGVDEGGLSSFATQALAAHNTFRAQHGAAALTWNSTIAALGQTWVDKCVFEHSGGTLGPFGENIAAGQSSIQDAVNDWTISGNPSEMSQYDANNPQGSHFTQVVWKASKQLGCAVASCNMPSLNAHGTSQYFICDYYPPGNMAMIGDGGASYRANVQV